MVIAEKPSVAQSIAGVLGASQRNDGYLEGNGYLVSWCIGHLVELAQPTAYGNYEKWRKEDLPILPEKWQYQITVSTKKQFQILQKLMNRSDVDRLICATDAGREGELIFRLVYHQCQCTKPFDRLWISSMEDSAIREGFQNLKPSSQYDSLYHAALCRERADWIIGINATRLFSCLYGQPLSIGRVMTPTLGMAVQREAAIAAFSPEQFYTVRLNANGINLDSQRFSTREDAAAILSACKNAEYAMIHSVTRKDHAEKPPALYDLTTLQRDANRLLGFTAQQALDYTQSLYEKKLVTYPRTDSRYLTEDMEPTLAQLVPQVAALLHVSGEVPLRPEQVMNNHKVTDHHAIIPTLTLTADAMEALPKGERELLKLIAVRKQQAIKDAFREWIWKDLQRRQTLVQLYNERYNSDRPREYDGSHIIFGGMSPEITLREHQRNAIAHILYGGNTLLAHEVGSGKTFEMVAAAMESRRLGLCSKSMIVVPNHLIEQWASEFLRLYPSANLLVARKKDFEPANRKTFCSKIATGEYDAVIIGHSQFEKIPMSLKRQQAVIEQQITEIEEGIEELKASGAERFTVKSMERTRKSLNTRLEKLMSGGRKDDVVCFEQLGVANCFLCLYFSIWISSSILQECAAIP